MKRFLNYYLSMAVIASLFVMTSCGEDDEPVVDAPVITLTGVTGDEVTVNPGEELDFTVNVTAPGGFNRLVIYETVGLDGTRQTLLDTARASGDVPTTFTLPVTYIPSAAVAGEDVYLEFFVVGEDLQETTREFIVRVNEPQVVAYNTILLQAPTTDQTNEAWFSTSTGERYSTQEVNQSTEPLSAQIDFGYRYGPTAGATLASPEAYPSEGQQNTSAWGTLNATMLRRVSAGVTETAFVEMGNTSGALVSAYEGGTAGTNPQRLTELQEGDVLAFLTDPDKPGEAGGRYGLIHVEEIFLGADGTGYGADAYISLNIKVQP